MADASWDKIPIDEALEDWERMRDLEDLRLTSRQFSDLVDEWVDPGRDASYLAVPSGVLVTASTEARLELPNPTDDDVKDVMERFAEHLTPESVEDEFARALGALDWQSQFSKLLTEHDLAERWQQFQTDVATVEIVHWLAGHGYRLRLE